MKKTKMTSLAITSSLVLSMFAATLPAMAEQYYSDVAEDHWAYSWVDYMHGKGYIHGYPDGTYRPDQNITRAEFVTILNYVLNSRNPANKDFTDVTNEDWFYDQIQWAAGAGYLSGYSDGSAKPNQYITREEAAVVVSKAYHLKVNEGGESYADADEASDWALPFIKTLTNNAILNGDGNGTFRPKDNILRAEVAVMIAKAEQNPDLEKEEVIYPDSLTKTEDGYTLSGITAKNLDKDMKVSVEVTENGNVGTYSVTAKIGDEVLVEKGTMEDLKAALEARSFSAEDLANLHLTFSGFEDAEAGSSLNVKITATDAENGVVIGSKNYNIAFGEPSIVWPQITGTRNNYQFTKAKPSAVANGKLILTNISDDELGAYSIEAKIGNEALGTFDSIEALNKAIEEKVWTDDSLSALTLTFTANGSQSFTLKFRASLVDATEGTAIGNNAEYTINFEKVSSQTGSLTGGRRTTPVDESRDRVAESLKDYQDHKTNSNSERAVADDERKHGISNDMLRIILTNDGLGIFDTSVSQTSKASNVVPYYNNTLFKELGDIDESGNKVGSYYYALYPISENVILYLMQDTNPDTTTWRGAKIETANKEDYVLLFRAMATTINGAANEAISLYNSGKYTGTDARDKYFEDFQNAVPDIIKNAIDKHCATLDDATREMLKVNAINYCTKVFNNASGKPLKDALADYAGKLNVINFANILSDYLIKY